MMMIMIKAPIKAVKSLFNFILCCVIFLKFDLNICIKVIEEEYRYIKYSFSGGIKQKIAIHERGREGVKQIVIFVKTQAVAVLQPALMRSKYA